MMTEQAEVLIQVEAFREENGALREQLRETENRAGEAEANLSRVLEDQRALLRRERRREREAQLEKMRRFESQLEVVVGKMQAAKAEAARATAEAEGQRRELAAVRQELRGAVGDAERKRQAILELQAAHEEVAERYAQAVGQQGDELALLRTAAQEAEAATARCAELEGAVRKLEAELSRRASLEGQCASLVEVVEEQQRMLLGLKEQGQRQREEAQRAAAREAEWRGKGKVWARERRELEKEVRDLRFQLQRALA